MRTEWIAGDIVQQPQKGPGMYHLKHIPSQISLAFQWGLYAAKHLPDELPRNT